VNARGRIVAVCLVGAAGGLLIALTASALTTCVVGLCVAGFFLYGVFGPIWAIAVDLAPPNARGVFTGSVNGCGQVGSFTSQITIGFLANSMKSFSGAIVFMMSALLIGAVLITLLRTLPPGTSELAI